MPPPRLWDPIGEDFAGFTCLHGLADLDNLQSPPDRRGLGLDKARPSQQNSALNTST